MARPPGRPAPSRTAFFAAGAAFVLPLLAGLLLPAAAARGQSVVLTPAQTAKLRELVKADAEAARHFDKLRRRADAALADAPDPIANIETQGKLKTDPAKVRTGESLKDMAKLEALGYAYAVTGEAKYAEKARAFVLAWAKANKPDGDPIDETNLDDLIVAYDLTRATFGAADREAVEKYLGKLADAELETARKKKDNGHNNWHSHRLKILGLVAYATADKKLIAHVAAEYREQVDKNLRPDGSSFDFHERDALHYHLYDVKPLLALAVAARNNGTDLYGHKSADGASLGKSVAFVVPYAEGKKTHAEFVHSKVAFDKKRAESGDKHYEAGHPFDPKSAGSTLALAEAFDPTLLPLVTKLTKPDAKRFPTWETVLNAARR
ncbi:MAG TPA: alginate lyase family protein [Humisphaera sp.]